CAATDPAATRGGGGTQEKNRQVDESTWLLEPEREPEGCASNRDTANGSELETSKTGAPVRFYLNEDIREA
ncbi:unnamed protein product, partial [Amoebophrya sp. A120]